VPQSFATAITWYRHAAEGGNAAGQFRLAFMYDVGLGIAKDEVQAVQWYRKAAEQGLGAAEDRLGRLYLDGLGVGQDYEQAWNWSNRAYAHGDHDAAALLCEMQMKRAVPPDAPARTEKWCDLQKAMFADFLDGTEPVPTTLTSNQLIAIVAKIEGPGFASRRAHPSNSRFYAAVTMRRPRGIDVLPSFNRHDALMGEGGSARVAVRGVYVSRSLMNDFHLLIEPGVHIVPEKDLPIIADGGCAVRHVEYDAKGHVALKPRCNGTA
jgi:hypothetical protein